MARPQTVLIVEDDQQLRHLLRNALSLSGYDVREARGGFEALRLLDSAPPDVVILYLALPGIDGFTVRHELAAHAHTRHIPVVIVTGSTDDLESLGVSCLLRKPVSPSEVVSAVAKCLGR
jgi:DNA-binding response OmpR family regulator